MTTEYVQSSYASKISGVTTQTIRNLCKAGTIRCRVRRGCYYPALEDVKRYASEICSVHTITMNIEAYQEELQKYQKTLIEEREKIRMQMEREQDSERLRLLDMQMFPERIKNLYDLLWAMLNLVSTNIKETNISRRDFEMMMMLIDGKTKNEVADEMYVSRERVKQIWNKCMLHVGEIRLEHDKLYDEVAWLKKVISSRDEMIAELTAKINGAKAPERDETSIAISKALDSEIASYDISVRCRNCLKWSDMVTFRDLIKAERLAVMKCRNFGKKSLDELTDLMESLGLSWTMNTNDYPPYVQL